jgi:hypothetical protein
MSLTPPEQERAIDPFSQYRWSQNLNRLSRAVTGGRNAVHFADRSFKLTKMDWKTVTVDPGIAFKDDVLIHIKELVELDFTNNEYYIDPTGTMEAAGYYYIVLQYYYNRSLPAPVALIRIIRDTALYYYPYETDLIFLGAAQVTFNVSESRFEINTIVTAVDIHAILIGDKDEPFLIDSEHNLFKLKINNDLRTVVLTLGSRTAAEICADINSAFGYPVASVYQSKRVKIEAPLVGVNSEIWLYGSGSTANLILGFVGDDDNASAIGQLTPPIINYTWGDVDGGWL